MTTSQISCELFHYNHLYLNIIYLASIQHHLYNNLTEEGIHFFVLNLYFYLCFYLYLYPICRSTFSFSIFVIFWNRDIRRITFLLFEYNVNPLFLNNLTNFFLLSLGVQMVVSKTELSIKFIIFYGDGWNLA